MSIFFSLLLNALVVIAIIAQFFFMGILAVEAKSRTERYIRVLAYTSGILVVLGAKALGTSISTILVRALSNSRPITIGLLGVAIPAAAGAIMAWYFVRTMRTRGANIATRVLIFIGVLAVTQFADVYAAAVRTHGLRLDPALAPNIAFVVGMSIYVMLTWDPENPQEDGLKDAIRKLKGRRS
ncbi:hypothetical protein [Streptomyces sp. SAI-149]|uniref:hypothetical protein n=1 Tax=Streptomyces sp. SAI-149 TaxID=2940542 RepID=UPI002476B158|nr:hypothetical protein [Streptomyces sp. SAI-149]MDH6499514.1 magnesium-transporting ATPase (P-type) [Streptomyces sp. SAI-149]